MIIKETYEYSLDNPRAYSLIDNVEKADVGCDMYHKPMPLNYVNVYLKNRKDVNEYKTINVEDIVVYICNDFGKTLNIVRPYSAEQILR